VHGFFFCRSYLRPEVFCYFLLPVLLLHLPLRWDCQNGLIGGQENQHVWWTKTEVQQWSVAAQKQAGYVMDHPFLGYCDETDPIERFRSSDNALH